MRIVYIHIIRTPGLMVQLFTSGYVQVHLSLGAAPQALQRGTLGYFDLSNLAFCYAYDKDMTIRVQDRAWSTSLRVLYTARLRFISKTEKMTAPPGASVFDFLYFCRFDRIRFFFASLVDPAGPASGPQRDVLSSPPPPGRLWRGWSWPGYMTAPTVAQSPVQHITVAGSVVGAPERDLGVQEGGNDAVGL